MTLPLLFGVLAVTCGGRLEMRQPNDGYADDQGVFRKANGEPFFEPGSACKGYDPSLFWTPSPQPCSGDGECQDLAKKRTPEGYPVGAVCPNRYVGLASQRTLPCETRVASGPNAGVKAGEPFQPKDFMALCNPGPAGDAFCRGWFGQFVNGSGRVSVGCGAVCTDPPPLDPNNPNNPGCMHQTGVCGLSFECHTDETAPECHLGGDRNTDRQGLLMMCVTREAGQPSRCEQPCKPL